MLIIKYIGMVLDYDWLSHVWAWKHTCDHITADKLLQNVFCWFLSVDECLKEMDRMEEEDKKKKVDKLKLKSVNEAGREVDKAVIQWMYKKNPKDTRKRNK